MTAHDLVPWMQVQLQDLNSESEEVVVLREIKPLQLQIVIACGTMARQLDAARLLIPLVDTFLLLLLCEWIQNLMGGLLKLAF